MPTSLATGTLPSKQNPYQMAILFALTRLHHQGKRHVYEGTVPETTVTKRRAANRIARKQRKVNSR